MPRKYTLTEERAKLAAELMERGLASTTIARRIGMSTPTFIKTYPDYKHGERPKAKITADQNIEIRQLLDQGYPLSQISARLDISYKLLCRTYSERRPGLFVGAVISDEELDRRLREYRRRDMANQALYHPKRDGEYKYLDLTSRLLGDPPPGRRELLEQWAIKNSNQISTDLNEEV